MSHNFNGTLSSDPSALNEIIRDTNLPTLASSFKIRQNIENLGENDTNESNSGLAHASAGNAVNGASTKRRKRRHILPKRRVYGRKECSRKTNIERRLRSGSDASEDDLNEAMDMVLLWTSGGIAKNRMVGSRIGSSSAAHQNNTLSDTIGASTISSTMLMPLTQPVDNPGSITLETPPTTPFHVAQSWAPHMNHENLHKLEPLTHQWSGTGETSGTTTLPDKRPVLRSERTSVSAMQRFPGRPSRNPSPSLSKITSNVNQRQRQKLHTMQEFASVTHEDSLYNEEISSKQNSEGAWDHELNQMRKQVRKMMKDMSLLTAGGADGEHSEHVDSNGDIGGGGISGKDAQGNSGDVKKSSLSKDLKFRMPNKSISGLSKRLQKRILSLRAHPAEMYTFKQEMEKIAEARRIAAKNRPKKNLTHVRNNMKNVNSQVLSMRISRHLEEHTQKLCQAKDKRLTIQEEAYLRKMNRFIEKQERIKEMSKFTSPAERMEAFQFNEKQRAWWKYVSLGVAFQRLHWALMKDRKKRVHTVTLNADATEEERRAFTIHKRRILMEIRNESKDDIAANPFMSHIRYTLNRKHLAAQMMRQYLREQLKSKVIIGTIRNYKFCVIRTQRVVRDFLVCKRAQEKLLNLQFKQYENKRIESSKKQMLQELSSIDSSTIASNSALQRQVQHKRQQLVNEEEIFATVPKEIRSAAVKQSIRKRRLAFVRQQVEWDRKIRLFREERRKTGTVDDLPKLFAHQHFSVLLNPRDINELIAHAEQKSTEMGRDLTLRRSFDKPLDRAVFRNLRRADSTLNHKMLKRKKHAMSRIRSMQNAMDA
eukprot:CAMPEP_0117445204 /NCGR_PEP_ID=MMETSP0759-20121206/5668_1 /TAXON_ID=63605 /ORGANISM="Percolomonas cosmopolitus, Strain WS" /LENGTH=821 /DNA_ID=CAMNT_0005237359 /DNA_START=160 /DNA_END=2625 /DNA_ORIENTATION=+